MVASSKFFFFFLAERPENLNKDHYILLQTAKNSEWENLSLDLLKSFFFELKEYSGISEILKQDFFFLRIKFSEFIFGLTLRI